MTTLTREPIARAPIQVRRHVVSASVITALGGLLVGHDTGVVSGALLFVKDDLGGLSSLQQELISTRSARKSTTSGRSRDSRTPQRHGTCSRRSSARRWTSSAASASS